MAEVKPKSICLIPNSQRRIVDFSVGCQKEKKVAYANSNQYNSIIIKKGVNT